MAEYAPVFDYTPIPSQEPYPVDNAHRFMSALYSTPITEHPSGYTTPFHRSQDGDNHSTYEHSPNHSAQNNSACRPVYFDSPTEDPSSSDPVEPAYELDSLDFKWKPFIQNTVDGEDRSTAPEPPPEPPVVCNSDDYYYEVQVEPEGEDDKDGQLYASINMESVESSSRFSFTLPEEPYRQEEMASTPDCPVLQCFAPAPGIFVSPLRDTEAHTSPAVAHLVSVDDAHGSQISDDTIEEWDDE